MSTRRLQVPPEQLERLGLHLGDLFHGKVEADGTVTMTVAPADSAIQTATVATKTWRERSEAWLAGAGKPQHLSDQEIDDARYVYLMEKHVWRHRPASP